MIRWKIVFQDVIFFQKCFKNGEFTQNVWTSIEAWVNDKLIYLLK